MAGPRPEHAAGRSGSIGLSLTTVPTIRSVTISPGRASFTDCTGGDRRLNTRSAAGELGFPNGECFVGSIVSGSYPITVTNTGIASNIDISGSSADPADGGSSWSLCSGAKSAAVACTGREHTPGPDQYEVLNFSPTGTLHGGITDTPQCDHVFGVSGTCWATEAMAMTEGIELIGPTWSSDTSTKWTITITWTPVPGRQG
jgi:hypothetical protein